MNVRAKYLLIALAIAGTMFLSMGFAQAAGTSFTCQGRLIDKTKIANGLYDLNFTLYDANVAGNQISSDIDIPDVNVIDGYFSVSLDFGSEVFDGNPAWLEIGVRPGSQEDPNIFTILDPRQEITAAPYAIHALNANASQPAQSAGAVYRWAIFDTYHNNTGWMMNNDSAMFGGVAPSTWTNVDGMASQMSADKEVLRTLFTRKGYGGKNANMVSQVFHQYSSTTGKVATALFRVKNNTAAAITWTCNLHYTCCANYGERASIAVNGTNVWNSGSENSAVSSYTNVGLPIPPGQTSTVIFVSTSGYPTSIASNISTRPLILAFGNNCLELPAGLEYVDDLDTATGGWEQ